MKLSKTFAAATIFFMLLFIPTNIYASAANTSAARQLYQDKFYYKVGTKTQLKLKGQSTGAVSWKSSKNNVVQIHQKTGEIRALKGGSSLITLKTKSGYTASYLIVVYNRKVQSPEPDPNRPFVISYGSSK